MTHAQLLGVIALTALLAVPLGAALTLMGAKAWQAISQWLPPRHLISRGERRRATTAGDEARS